MTSPGYPDPMPADAKCAWFFKIPKDHSLYAKFEELVLQPEKNCSAAGIAFQGYMGGKQCSSPKRVIAFHEVRTMPSLTLTTSRESHSAKFKLLATVLTSKPLSF